MFKKMSSRPVYQVLQQLSDNIEIRKYPSIKWAITSTNGNLQYMDQHRNLMFQKLFGYISGQNDQNQKIAMTAPVTYNLNNQSSNTLLNNNSNCNITMRFYVPQELYSKTPNPTGDAYIQTEPEMIVAAIRFGGFATMNDYLYNRDVLIQKLGAEASKYDVVNMITAGYDPPFRTEGRTNEVWFRKIT